MSDDRSRRINVWREKAESAASYSRGIGDWVTARETRLLMDLLPQDTGLVLDFPSGSGRLTKIMIELGHQVVAADLLSDMAVFTRNLVGPRVVQADIFAPPFRHGSFQAILAIRIFFHYRNQAALLSALATLLAPGGRLVFDTLNPVSIRRLVSPLLSLIRRGTNRSLVFSPPNKISGMARELGLRLAACKGLHILPTRAYRCMPDCLLRLLQGLEEKVAEDHRILTFWAFDRP